MTRFKHFSINELEILRKVIIASIELERISGWVSGQNSDGLGEGFEQQDFANYIMKDGKLLDFEKDEYDDEDWKTASFDWETNEYKFDLIACGEKTEEYRNIKPYYTKRFKKAFSSIGKAVMS